MRFFLNSDQEKALSTFFNNIAVAWFIGLFVVPKLSSDLDLLTVMSL